MCNKLYNENQKNVSNETVLITGGAGFIGSHVVDMLTENGYNAVVVDNFSSVNSKYKNSNAKYYNIDILSDDFEQIFKDEKPKLCIHLAAQTSVVCATQNPIFDATQNIIGSLKVIQYCKEYNVEKVIVASTAAVYGNPQYLPVDEQHQTNTISSYGLSKLTMENYIKQSGLPYVIYRFANVYGERQNAKGEAGVVAIFMDAMKENKTIYINGDGEQTRDFIYVKDVAKACLNAIKNDIKNETMNVSTNSACSINKLFENMAKLYNYKSTPKYVSARDGDIRHSVLNNSKYIKLTNCNDFMDIEQGLKCVCLNKLTTEMPSV